MSEPGERPAALEEAWFGARREEQQRALPGGEVLLSCSAAPGAGGLGRHSDEIALALEQGAHPRSRRLQGGGSRSRGHSPRGLRPLVRRSPPWRAWADCVAYDRYAARRLGTGEHLIAFNGEAGAQFQAARRAGFRSVSLMAANSHMENVIARHAQARLRHPIEHS